MALTFQCSTAVCMTLAGVPLSASMMRPRKREVPPAREASTAGFLAGRAARAAGGLRCGLAGCPRLRNLSRSASTRVGA